MESGKGSTTFRLNVLPTLHADGATQMAFDLALLDHAHATPGTIWLRTYTWSAPTLSLGYFQPWKTLPELVKKAWDGVAVVRRPTGGGAIWHDGDLTYAVVVPSAHPWAGQARRLYQGIHDALAAIMTEDGAEVVRRQIAFPQMQSIETVQKAGNAAAHPSSPFLCFEDGDADDLLLDGVKVVGGAQRRRGWASLQHGSIHWRRSSQPTAAHLPGLLDLRPNFAEKSPVKWAEKLGPRLVSAWGLEMQSVQPPPEVIMAAHAWSNRLKEAEWLDKR